MVPTTSDCWLLFRIHNLGELDKFRQTWQQFPSSFPVIMCLSVEPMCFLWSNDGPSSATSLVVPMCFLWSNDGPSSATSLVVPMCFLWSNDGPWSATSLVVPRTARLAVSEADALLPPNRKWVWGCVGSKRNLGNAWRDGPTPVTVQSSPTPIPQR